MKLILLKPSEKIAKIKITSKKDLWYLKQILEEGDTITSKTARKVDISKNENKRRIIKTSVVISIKINEIEYQINSLKVKGKIIFSSDERIPNGRTHSFIIKINKIFKIEKKWQKKQIDLLKEASKNSFSSKILACSLDEKKASIARINNSNINFLRKLPTDLGSITKSITDLLSEINPEIIIIASNNNLNKELRDKLIKKSPNLKEKIRLQKVSSGADYGIKELLGSGEINKMAKEFKEKKEENLLNKLKKEITKDLAAYGLESVKKAISFCAAKELLISETFFDKNRENAEKMMSSAKKINCESYIISSEKSLENLNNFGEIAAILRFRIPDN